MTKCLACQEKERKAEIGPNQAAYDLAIRGNTMGMNPCEVCGKPEEFYKVDFDRAIRASNNEYIHPLEWD